MTGDLADLAAWPAIFDGRSMRLGDVMIPATDDGFIRGDGAFDAFLVRDGRPFARRAHIDRLARSCSALDLPLHRDAVEADVDRLLADAPAGDAVVRIIITRGGHRLCRLEPRGDPAQLTRPVRLAPVTFAPSVILNNVKTLSYAANMAASRRAIGAGFDEALLVAPDGTVLEGPTCSIFWVRDEQLVTPALSTGILASITRRAMLERMDVQEATGRLEDLLGADEAFLVSTGRLAQPVAAVGETELPAAPGPVTERAQAVLDEAIRAGEL